MIFMLYVFEEINLWEIFQKGIIKIGGSSGICMKYMIYVYYE